MTSPIDPIATLQQSETVLATDLGEEIITMHVESGRYLMLQNEAVDIWRLLAERTNQPAIVDALTADYDISREDCAKAVCDLVNELAALELITVSAA